VKKQAPSDAPPAEGGYSQGIEVTTPGRFLHISGQIPVSVDGTVAEGAENQCRQVWQNVSAVLRSAGMTVNDLVKVTTYLADRSLADVNSRVRSEFLEGAEPAITVVIAGIYDESWLLEVEAVAFSPRAV